MADYVLAALLLAANVVATPTGSDARQSARKHPMESSIRLSLFHECGGDLVPACVQFAPLILRGKDPVIALEGVRCDQSGQYPRMKQACSFLVRSPRSGATTACTIRFQEVPGHHSTYWSDRDPTSDPSPTGKPDAVAMSFGRSSLRCSNDLRSLPK